MNYLRVLSRIVCFGAALLIIAGRAGAQDTLPAPIRDYWPTVDWKVSTPEQQGMDSQILTKIKPYVEQELPQVRSVLIVRHGYLVYEQYFQYFNRDHRQNVGCVTKSISSALVGIALKEGYLKSLDQKLVEFFPEYMKPDVDPRVQKITLKHLLTLSSGFDKGDIKWKTIQEKFQQKPIHEPGQFFEYDDHALDLLSAIFIKATNMDILDFAKRHLFVPLGISEITWEEIEKSKHLVYGISMKPRDMAKFGYLYLNNGIWNGKQIVPLDFVKESTQKQITTDWPYWPSPSDYGYLWWVLTMEKHPVYAAAGWNGQFILIFPDLDMVVVITSGGNGTNKENFNIIGKYVIPSILK